MKTRFFEKAVLVAALSFGAANVMATPVTLDLDSADQYEYGAAPYVESGFQLIGGLVNWDFTNFGFSPYDLDPTGHALASTNLRSPISLQALNGGSFDFLAIDLGDFLNGYPG